MDSLALHPQQPHLQGPSLDMGGQSQVLHLATGEGREQYSPSSGLPSTQEAEQAVRPQGNGFSCTLGGAPWHTPTSGAILFQGGHEARRAMELWNANHRSRGTKRSHDSEGGIGPGQDGEGHRHKRRNLSTMVQVLPSDREVQADTSPWKGLAHSHHRLLWATWSGQIKPSVARRRARLLLATQTFREDLDFVVGRL